MLSINPQSSSGSNITSDASGPSTPGGYGRFTSTTPPNAIDKAALDSKINQLSGGVGSSYNWAGTGGTPYGGYGSSVAGAGNTGGVTGTVQSKVSSITSTAQKAAAGVSNIFSNVNRSASQLNKLTGGNIAGTLQDLSAKVSGFAGQVNNLLSVARGQGIPKGGETFASQQSTTEISATNESDWRVRIRLNSDAAYDELLGSSVFINMVKDRGGVVWPYTPSLTLSTKANYTSIESIHSNYPFYAYKNSAVEDITIQGDFSVETSLDAAYWIAATMFLRAVTKMYFGQGPNAGNPPPICVLDGYGSSIFKNIPVIVKSFSVDLKDDTNYIYYEDTKTWVPIMSSISAVVAPIYNRSRLRQFNLQQYAAGNMLGDASVGYL